MNTNDVLNKLIAEIEGRIQWCEDCERDGYPDTTSSEATLKSLRSFITSLQQEQPEMDLEEEIEEYFKGWTETDEGIACHYQYVDLNTCRGIARHFYELGINARKEE